MKDKSMKQELTPSDEANISGGVSGTTSKSSSSKPKFKFDPRMVMMEYGGPQPGKKRILLKKPKEKGKEEDGDKKNIGWNFDDFD